MPVSGGATRVRGGAISPVRRPDLSRGGEEASRGPCRPPAEEEGQGAFECRVEEGEALPLEGRGEDALAPQQQRLAHLPEEGLEGEGGHGGHGRTVQGP